MLKEEPLNNKAIIEGSFFYRIEDKEDTVLVIVREHNITPPLVMEITGYNKSNFLNDWGINNNEDTKSKGTT